MIPSNYDVYADLCQQKIGTLHAKLAAESDGNADVSPAAIELASYRRDINNVINENTQLQSV